MTTEQIAVRKNLYRMIRALPEDKVARTVVFIKSMEEEPPLTEEEENGVRESYAALARGEGRPFREAFKDLL